MLQYTNMKKATYTITELAREFDVTTRTIRFYEDQGLLNPSRNGRRRVYSHRDRVRLKLTLRGKRLGFSLSEIKELFDLYDSARGEIAQLEQFLIILGKRRAALEQQRQDIDAMLAEIAAFEKQCRRMLEEKAGANRPVREPT
ncbi:MerR family transcriptional regulator [Pelomicrobium methylotrophicum]|uniref:MerR family DNA-binding transcriptional regulator n=1 Tax=Pelomicrobium methylotrophicum TaxID=2602750 RepID=A0A5C7EM26_9PROT|nr:MerR family DNA-binding transcriptional regulator [Pelomicrobium methylotrophicum]TXF12633.1 MerR family DNA-binding transcriptional regulator [Pelomicrobium methylotrophicum]